MGRFWGHRFKSPNKVESIFPEKIKHLIQSPMFVGILIKSPLLRSKSALDCNKATTRNDIKNTYHCQTSLHIYQSGSLASYNDHKIKYNSEIVFEFQNKLKYGRFQNVFQNVL